jgi:enterochelin esterase-like enzyme
MGGVRTRVALVAVPAVAACLGLAALAGAARVPPSAATALPPSWRLSATGPGGGSVWTGTIPNPGDRAERPSAVYLPPGFTSARRYPVLYLLHGLPGAPASYWGGLRLAPVLDGLIAARRAVPMIVVLPAGADSEKAEWAGRWERFVVRDVVPWVDGHLPTIRTASARVLGGLCAGGFGAMDIGLRNPGVFGGLESWEGYFAPVFHDGPFVGKPATYLAANDPTLLVRRDAARLRRSGVGFYVSVGGNHANVLRAWSLRFAALLSTLHLEHTLWRLPARDRGHFWRATLPSAIRFASNRFAGLPV